MLKADLSIPSVEVGSAVERSIDGRPDWLRRRIDTVELVDDLSVTRQYTFDIDTHHLANVQNGMPLTNGYVVVPIMVMKKQLLVDGDLRAPDGKTVHIGTRRHDSYLALSYFIHVASTCGHDVPSRPKILQHVSKIIENFPLGKPQNPLFEQIAWVSGRSDWDKDDDKLWEGLLKTYQTCTLLLDLTYGFLLVAYLPVTDDITVLKFTCRQELPNSHERWYERFPLRNGLPELRLRIPMPPADNGRSSHLRIIAPDELQLHRLSVKKLTRPTKSYTTWSAFWARSWRSWADGARAMISRVPWKVPSEQQRYEEARNLLAESGEHCQSLLTPDRANVYIESPKGKFIEARVSMHVPRSGFLRAALVAVGIVFGTLLTGLIFMGTLHKADTGGGTTEAAVTLLLLAPGAFAAWAVRYGEHTITARLLIPIRASLILSVGCSFVTAVSVVFYDTTNENQEHTVWTACVIASGLVLGVSSYST